MPVTVVGPLFMDKVHGQEASSRTAQKSIPTCG